ncbi:MAG: benzoyl-CoA reductase, bzd-type, subunit O [Candidatus Bipolaricaulia bacterium]
MAGAKYKTKDLECWGKAKELRMKYYKDYAESHARGGLCWEGGAWSFDAIPQALEGEVHSLTEEPYGASVGANPPVQVKYQEAAEGRWGCARDLCAYMRNYWGSIISDEYVFGGPWPKADFIFQNHICCSHAKWLQVASELEGGIPFFCFDVGAGPYNKIEDRQINYVVEQLYDGIEFLEKTTGRKIDDEKLARKVENTYRSACYWAKTCCLNKAVPAPLDEKTMFALYVLGTLEKSSDEVADFYEKELYPEVLDRVKEEIAAVENERCRVIGDSQPPWAFLKVLRYVQRTSGVNQVASLYTFSLIGWFKIDEDGEIVPYPTLKEQGIKIRNREQALWLLAEGELKGKLMWAPFYGAKVKNELVTKMAEQWKCDAAMIHLNRGCEGTAQHQMEMKIALADMGLPVMTYEGNMADEREFDEARTLRLMDLFLTETMGLRPLE